MLDCGDGSLEIVQGRVESNSLLLRGSSTAYGGKEEVRCRNRKIPPYGDIQGGSIITERLYINTKQDFFQKKKQPRLRRETVEE